MEFWFTGGPYDCREIDEPLVNLHAEVRRISANGESGTRPMTCTDAERSTLANQLHTAPVVTTRGCATGKPSAVAPGRRPSRALRPTASIGP